MSKTNKIKVNAYNTWIKYMYSKLLVSNKRLKSNQVREKIISTAYKYAMAFELSMYPLPTDKDNVKTSAEQNIIKLCAINTPEFIKSNIGELRLDEVTFGLDDTEKCSHRFYPTEDVKELLKENGKNKTELLADVLGLHKIIQGYRNNLIKADNTLQQPLHLIDLSSNSSYWKLPKTADAELSGTLEDVLNYGNLDVYESIKSNTEIGGDCLIDYFRFIYNKVNPIVYRNIGSTVFSISSDQYLDDKYLYTETTCEDYICNPEEKKVMLLNPLIKGYRDNKQMNDTIEDLRLQIEMFIKEQFGIFLNIAGLENATNITPERLDNINEDFCKFLNSVLMPTVNYEEYIESYNKSKKTVDKLGLNASESDVNKYLKESARFSLMNVDLSKDVEKQSIDNLIYRPFTKRDILNQSVGEIVNPETFSSTNDIESPKNHNTIYNNFYFYRKQVDRNQSDMEDLYSSSYAHIMLTLPIVHPSILDFTEPKKANRRMRSNHVKSLLGMRSMTAPDSDFILGLANYEWCIVIPKNQSEVSKMLSKESTYGLLRHKSVGKMTALQMFDFEPQIQDGVIQKKEGKTIINNLYKYFFAVKSDMINSNCTVDSLKSSLESAYKNKYQSILERDNITLDQLVSSDFWLDNMYILSGAYAVTYLLANVDISNNLKYGNQLLCNQAVTDKAFTSESRELCAKHLAKIKGIASDSNASMIDWVTNVVPVIPFAYRPYQIKETNGQRKDDRDPFNNYYIEILETDKGIPGKVIPGIRKMCENLEIVPYEHLFECTQMIVNEDNPNTIEKLKVVQEDLLNKITKIFYNSNGSAIIDGCKKIQNCTIKYQSEQMNKLQGKYGDIRDEGLSKRFNDTARAVITADPSLELDQVGIPYDILKNWYKVEIESYIRVKMGWNKSTEEGKERIDRHKRWIEHLTDSEEFSCTTTQGKNLDIRVVGSIEDVKDNLDMKQERDLVEKYVIEILNELIKDNATLMIRFPSLWKYNELVMEIVIVRDQSIHFHPLCCKCYNADFDGDTMSAYLIRTKKAVEEGRRLLAPSKNKKGYNGSPMLTPSQDSILGIYYLTLNKDLNDIEKGNPNKARTASEPNVSPVIATYSTYEEMMSAFERREIGLTDKVCVYLPRYDQSLFLRDFLLKQKLDDVKTLNNTAKELSMPEEPLFTETADGKIQIKTSKPYNGQVEAFAERQVPDMDDPENYRPVISTVGRFIFNAHIPQDLGFVKRDESNPESLYALEIDNDSIKSITGKTDAVYVAAVNKKVVTRVIEATIDKYETNDDDISSKVCNRVHDNLKYIGFHFATISGLSLSLNDMNSNDKKQSILNKYQKNYDEIIEREENQVDRDREVVDNWMKCTDEVTKTTLKDLPITNTLRMMWFSGARGSESQLSQLMGMRGIMLNADSEPMKTPIKTNFIEGLSAEDMYIASYGANKGMIDRANKTQGTGEFTRTAIFGTEGTSVQFGDCGDLHGTLFKSFLLNAYNFDPISGIGYKNIKTKSDILYVSKGVLMRKDGEVIIDREGNLRDGRQLIYNIYTGRVLNRNVFEKSQIQVNKTQNKQFDSAGNIIELYDETEIVLPGISICLTNIKNIGDNHTIRLRRVQDSENDRLIFTEKIIGNVDDYILNGFVKDAETSGDNISEIDFESETGEMYSAGSSDLTKAWVSTGDGEYIYFPYDALVSGDTQIGDGNYYIHTTDNGVVCNKTKPESLKDFEVKSTPTTIKVINSKNVGFICESKDIADDYIGRFVAQPVYDKITGELLISTDNPLKKTDKKLIKRIVSQYPEGVYLRSPISCKSHEGICAKCYGFNNGVNRYADIGDQVDKAASHVLGEYLSQSTMRTFHTGGAATGGNVTDTFEAVKALLESGKLEDDYIKALSDSIAQITEDDVPLIKKLQDRVVRTLRGIYKNFEGFQGQLNTPVINDEIVSLEDFGVYKYGDYVEIMRYVMDQLQMILTTGGVSANSIHLEVLIKSMFRFLIVIDSGDSDCLVGSSINLNDLIKKNVQLATQNREPIIAVLKFCNLNACAGHRTKPMQSMQSRESKERACSFSLERLEDTLDNSITSIFVGNQYYSGTVVQSKAKEKAENLKEVKTINSIAEDYNKRVKSGSKGNELSILRKIDEDFNDIPEQSQPTPAPQPQQTTQEPQQPSQEPQPTSTSQPPQQPQTTQPSQPAEQQESIDAAVFGDSLDNFEISDDELDDLISNGIEKDSISATDF